MKKWLMADLHIHSTFSDGTESIEEIIKIYGEAGFDVIAITDHLFDTQTPRSLEIHEEGKSIRDVESYFKKIEEASQWAKQTFDLLVIPGLEICNLSEDYHILGLDLKEPLNPNQEAEGVIDEIHRQGGLAIASHPPLKLSFFLQGDHESIRRHPLHLWKHRTKYLNKIDAWEIANRDDLFDRVALEGLPYIACSDFHDREHLSSWKSLIFSEKETEAIKRAIRERKLSLFYFSEKRKDRKPIPIGVGEEGAAGAGSSHGKGRKKILIADDEKDLVELIVYHLTTKGYSVVTAFNGLEAWEKIQTEKPDAIVLDLMMPDLDGWDLCQMIRRSENKEIKAMGILILSARAMAEDRVYGLEIGADDYLTKPFSMEELVLRVEKLAEKRINVAQFQKELESLHSFIEEKKSNLRRVVHDLKSPLISIGFSAKRLMRRNLNEETSSGLETIFNNSLQLTRWIDKTLLSDNREPLRPQEEMEEVDLRSLISKTIDLLKEVALEKKIEIEVSLPQTVPKILCQESMMLRALVNLLSNALKFTPPHGQIVISAVPYFKRLGTGVLEISFKDSGIGIHEEDQQKIFLPYYRGKNVHGEEGKGLGLSFVKEVVDLHGGKILVQSTPNGGSLFSILLPVRSSPEELV
jgi:signal transduction histidine kinase/predicted metal-dependent phosphoesterase TrpH